MKHETLTRKQTALADVTIIGQLCRNHANRAKRRQQQEATEATYHDDDLDVGRGSNPRPQQSHDEQPFCNDGAVAYL